MPPIQPEPAPRPAPSSVASALPSGTVGGRIGWTQKPIFRSSPAQASVRRLPPSTMGTMGVGLPYALGAKLAAGASGYLLKTQDTDQVIALLQDVERGEVALSPGLASRVLNEFRRRATLPPGVEEKRPAASLSLRETQVLTLVAQGLTYKEVGAKLNLSERTIKYHMGEIVGRLHLESRSEAIEYARRAGMVR